jgi:hypothetical protein
LTPRAKKHSISDKLGQELVIISYAIVKQNYFQFLSTPYVQEGLAMGAPTSSVFSEMYLQSIENTAIYDILVKKKPRYVDDILIIYNKPTTNINDVFNNFNNLMPTMKFTMEKEIDKINFLYITIQK